MASAAIGLLPQAFVAYTVIFPEINPDGSVTNTSYSPFGFVPITVNGFPV